MVGAAASSLRLPPFWPPCNTAAAAAALPLLLLDILVLLLHVLVVGEYVGQSSGQPAYIRDLYLGSLLNKIRTNITRNHNDSV